MHVRDLGPGDVDRMYALDVLCFDPPFRFSRAAMRRFSRASNALVRLAVGSEGAGAGEVLLGFCIAHLEPSSTGIGGYIVTLDVDPGARGRGVATLLMTELETAATRVGAAAMSLHVFSGNGAAVSLYEKLGYRYVSTALNFYGRGLDAFGYTRILPHLQLEENEAGRGGGRAEAS